MRLHQLTMTAIGPYTGTEMIDFDRLSSHGRFLLAGPTGSGKSTIIDAIVFALYGEVAGEKDSSKDRMRSRLVDPATESVVDLVFSTSAGRYRVRRTPAYQRPKRRGEGMTTQNATVKVWRLAGPDGTDPGETALRPDEAGPLLRRAVGLSRDQFTQTIVLPQGKFARFLRASSAERHDLLREVFGTHLYDDLQDWLVTRSRDLTAQVAQARSEVSAALDQLTQLTAAAPSHPASDEGSGDHRLTDCASTMATAARLTDPDLAVLASAATELTSLLSEQGDAAQAALERAAQERQEAEEYLREQTGLEERLERRQRLLAERAVLDGQADEVASQEAELAQARRAGAVGPYLDASTQALQEAEDAVAVLVSGAPAPPSAVADELTHALQDLKEPGTQALGPLPQAEDLAASLQQDASGLRERAGALSHAAELERSLTGREEELAQQRQLLEQARARLDAEHAELEALPAQRARLEAELALSREAALAEAAHRQALQDAEAAATAAAAVPPAQEAVARTERERQEAARLAAGCEARTHELRSAWIAATAASLVGELVEDQPCPVCGSPSHPRPAPSQAHTVSREDLEQAEARYAQAREHFTQSVRAHEEAAAALKTAVSASQGLDPQQAQARVEAARTALDATLAQAGRQASLDEELAALIERSSSLQARLAAHQAQAEADHAALTRLTAQIEVDRAAVTRARGEASSVAERRSMLLAEADRTERTAAATRRGIEALARAHRAGEQLAHTREEAGFTDEAALRAAQRPAGRMHELEEALAGYRSRREAVVTALAEPALAGLTGSEVPRVEQARSRREEAASAWEQAAQAQGRHQERAAATVAAADRVTALTRQLADLLAGSAALVGLTALARGDNLQDTPLATWVLAERFRDVMSFANARLAHISQGRYELVPAADEKQSARRRGLGLGVRDNLGAGVRDPRTLSGGESFYVSLALALALADVVASESGGIRMDTLFIDEGFGSLDPETLDAVLAELGRLQDGGRTVGIVSHVAELRRQIPDQVVVTPTATGSHLRVVGP